MKERKVEISNVLQMLLNLQIKGSNSENDKELPWAPCVADTSELSRSKYVKRPCDVMM